MVTDSEGYSHLLGYLAENLELFARHQEPASIEQCVLECFEEQLSAQVILLCGQHPALTFEQRNMIIREVDAIVADLEEVMASVVNNSMTEAQALFITEYAGLIKNLFDSAISAMVVNASQLDVG